jgi:Protein of unknown function (DUF5674)
MIYLLRDKVTPSQISDMLEFYSTMIKITVDIRKGILAGGGEMNVDCEMFLLADGSEQDDLWGANWYPSEQRVEYEALINIRPRLRNRSMVIQSEEVRKLVEAFTRRLLGGIS